MAAVATNKTIDFVRIGNPWLVGKNVNRVVPVYALQNVLAPDFDRDDSLQAIKDLAFDVAKALDGGLRDRISVAEQDIEDLERTVFGLLAPERRIFRDKANGGASKHGSLFPLVAGLVSPVGSDDGLGRRMRELLELHATDWQARLVALLAPTSARDPATAFSMALLRGLSGQQNPRTIAPPPKPLRGIDLACADFVDKLIINVSDARRVSAIRNLAFGNYLAAVIRMVAGPAAVKHKRVPLVLVYGGLPPGRSADPLVRSACKSFQNWISASWHSTIDLIHEEISSAPYLPNAKGSDRLRQQVRGLLQDRLGSRQRDVEGIMTSLDRRIDGARFGPTWCRETLESRVVGFKKSELARRVRSLGGNIGFTGPDRGTGSPRLVLDTPILGVLVRGIVGVGAMEFDQFVSELAKRFGLVVGFGQEDSIAEQMETIGSDGYDAYEILQHNQELLRERMLRAGLARAYSDSHTEVYNDA